jgi:hypothetical protein
MENRFNRCTDVFSDAVCFEDKRNDVIAKMGEPTGTRIENEPPSLAEYDRLFEEAERTGVDVQTVLRKLRTDTYKNPAGYYWCFKYRMKDGILYSASCSIVRQR